MPTPTKQAIVLRALRRAGLASSAMLLAPEPESIQDGLQDLEDMMAAWEGDGVPLSYRYTSAPEPQPDEESGIPDWSINAVVHNLALVMCVDNQRPIPAKLDTLAYNDLRTVKARLVTVPSLQRRNDMPRGTGNATGIDPFGRGRFYLEHDSLTDDNGKAIDI